MKEFRIVIAGRPFNKEEWKKFYEKNQKFTTLCIDCNFRAKQKILKNSKKNGSMKLKKKVFLL